MTAFTYKGYGRIYTDPEYIQDVEKIIQELDEFEYQNYFPESLVGFWDDYPIVVCVGNFALDEEKFKQICKERNIPVFIFDAGCYGNLWTYEATLTKEQIQQISYKVTMVEFDKLSKREQESIERVSEKLAKVKENMMFQTQKVSK